MKITVVDRKPSYFVKKTINRMMELRKLTDHSDAVDDDDNQSEQNEDALAKINTNLWGLYHACQDFDFEDVKSIKVKNRIDILRKNTLAALNDMNDLEESCGCGKECEKCQYFDYCELHKKEDSNDKN